MIDLTLLKMNRPTSSYILNKSNNKQFHNKENITGINELRK
ncbi:hypothetical protein [Mycoplasmopsis edwardii]|nr:hypothetical protein [Mycoplasmopsis edwardii]